MIIICNLPLTDNVTVVGLSKGMVKVRLSWKNSATIDISGNFEEPSMRISPFLPV